MKRLYQGICNSKILIFAVDDKGEATQMFELHNDRGKRLTQLEAVKSFIMHSIYLKSSSQERYLLEDIQRQFGMLYRTYERILNVPYKSVDSDDGEDSVLRYHCIAFEDWNDNVQPKALIKETIRRQQDDKVIIWAKRFVRELRESFAIFLNLHEERDRLHSLGDLYALGRIATFYPLLIKTYKLDLSHDKLSFQRVAKLVEMFSFRAYGLANKKTNTGVSWFNTTARDFRAEDFDKLIAELKKACTNDWNVEKGFEQGLADPDFYNSQSQDKDALYLLWKYENHLRGETGRTHHKISWREFLNSDPKEKLTIEHIAAQQGDEVRSSLVMIDGDNEKFKKEFLHSLGNLVIDSHSANASKGKNPFLSKDVAYAGAPIMSQNELKLFTDKESPTRWDASAIQKRSQKLIKFARQAWNPMTV